MSEKIKDYLELIRLPGMFTAHGDVLAGFLIAGAGFKKINILLWLLLSSSCLFSAGMALNDYFDHGIDARERPQRPIPSGRISRSSALALGVGLLAAGVFFAFFAGTRPFYVSLALTASILLYDALLKDIAFLGPLTMASCRYFNLLMALSILPFKGWALVPLITGTYILGVTTLSQKEAQGGKAVVNIGFCALCVGMTSLIYYFLFLQGVLLNFSGAFLAIVFALFLSKQTLNLLENHRPKDFQATMKVLLLSIIILDWILASGSVPFYYAAFILLLYFPAFLSVRLFKIT
ncbi:MAG: UbiA family prenyltransferase [Desulfobacterium sp.]|jgi:4-hydroxybenzoate polyprenyltransferase|nr:UbiA family prenyltransferase [Desulfobacterium sp.]